MKEEQIRPKKIFDKYIQLAIQDTKFFFKSNNYKNINCIACTSKGKKLFIKHDFQYNICESCFSIYVSPRPSKRAFFNYYINSKSSKFWATTFYKVTENSRKKNLWKPKAKKIYSILNKYFQEKKCQIVDIGGGYGLFADEIKKKIPKVSIIEPAPHLAEICRNKGHNVINKFLEDVKPSDFVKGRKLYVSFELIEHLHSPRFFFKKLHKLFDHKDIFVFTTLSGMGLDIATLGKKSKSIMPPYHLNFFNPYSIKIFLKKNGFDILQITTPGKLDLDILNNNLNNLDNLFWKYILKKSSEAYLNKLQGYISSLNLSSHMMVVCKKSYEKN